jgi:YebC/PmpR family DNA-binding regulatory protein
MSGHSKWATIKHKKALIDAKRGKVFTKMIKEITVAARTGGGDPNGNPRLRLLIDKAKSVNMPMDNMNRAIKKGTGELPGVAYESYMYEGYGPHNVAVVVEVLTDNKNKAVAELRHAFSRNGGHMAEAGSVLWMFERLGVLHVTGADITEERLIDLLLDYDPRDIRIEDGAGVVTCDPKHIESLKDVLTKNGFKVTDAEVEWLAHNSLVLESADEEKTLAFLEAIDELDDVQNVYTNMA